jgi:glutamate---cysteine ligase / carboxylate-amine ligase
VNPYTLGIRLPDVVDLSRGDWFSLGIEEEFQIVDPETRDLRSHIEQILEEGRMLLAEHIKPEMHQSVVEVGTAVCNTMAEARREVTRLRTTIADIAKKSGMRIAAAGTHPFSHWFDQKITDNPRYHTIIADMQQVARANLIFGLHVHVGIPDDEVRIQIMNTVRYFLPHIFALSTNSPFWVGRDTGFKSYRIKVFERFPRTGFPDRFNSYGEYQSYVDTLVKTNCIDNAKKIWWDVRPHPHFNTLEYRICDIPMRIDESLMLAALFQAVTAKLYLLHRLNLDFRHYTRALLNENRWRAARFGIEGKLIDFGKKEEVDERILIGELLGFIDDVVDDLGSRSETEYVRRVLEDGTGADRQLRVFRETKDTKRVVDYIIQQTHLGIE